MIFQKNFRVTNLISISETAVVAQPSDGSDEIHASSRYIPRGVERIVESN
jgi:hypothetical protein